MSRYAKAITAVVGLLATWAATYFPDDHSLEAAIGLLGVVATAFGVYAIPNTPPAGQPADPDISEVGPRAPRAVPPTKKATSKKSPAKKAAAPKKGTN